MLDEQVLDTHDEAPSMAVYEARANEDGLMRIDAVGSTACGLEFEVPYMVEAFLPRSDRQPPLETAEHAALDIMRALMGSAHGAMQGVRLHRIVGRGRARIQRGSKIIPVQIHGAFKITESLYP